MPTEKVKWTWQGCQVREDCPGAYEGKCGGCKRELVLKSEALKEITRQGAEITRLMKIIMDKNLR